MRRDALSPAGGHEVGRVIAPVCAHRHPPTRMLGQHFKRSYALAVAVRFAHAKVHEQPVAIIHEGMSRETQLGFATTVSSFSRKLFIEAQASSNVPSTLKCSRLIKPRRL